MSTACRHGLATLHCPNFHACSRTLIQRIKLAIFPLTDSLNLVALQRLWLSLCAPPTKQPRQLVKDYFGEKIALYFVWLGHYTSWLTSASMVGFFCWVAISADGNDPDSPSVPYFTVFMSLWASFYLESWKREEKAVALEWGMIDFEDEEQSRPEFEAIAFYRESPVTGKQEKFFPAAKRYPVLAYSAAISATFIITVSAAIIGIYIFRAFLSSPAPWGKVYLGDGNEDDDASFALGGILGSAINAVQVSVQLPFRLLLSAPFSLRTYDMRGTLTTGDHNYERSV